MTVERVPYDEFDLLHENAEEYGLPFDADNAPPRRREFVDVDSDRRLSAIVWGDTAPELVFLHGGAQNAHTWDTVALALGRPLLAVDLPGHGHSDSGRQGSLSLDDNADDVATVVRQLAPEARAVVGMSMGGLTTLALAGRHPDLVQAVVLVDILPSVRAQSAALITAFVNGPESFPNFDELLQRTIEHNPTRSVSSLRRGILHNAVQREDGSWVWRHARHRATEVRPSTSGEGGDGSSDGAPTPDRYAGLWDVVSSLTVPVMLVRGMRPASVVDDEHEAELVRRQPGARVEHVQEAGHSVQGDAPLELAALIDDFVG